MHPSCAAAIPMLARPGPCVTASEDGLKVVQQVCKVGPVQEPLAVVQQRDGGVPAVNLASSHVYAGVPAAEPAEPHELI
jgi:hypothetical protein